jgi:amidase
VTTVFRTAHEIAEAIRIRRVSAVEAVTEHLAQIERHNGALNAIVTLAPDRALERARAADAALAAGSPWGPLHGVPITLKDCHATSGMRTTVGFSPLADHVPAEDGTVAARMQAAGAILLGKTNVPPLLGGGFTDNPIFGRTNNPYDLARTPGGSSGGSAAAVAAGLVPLDVGSDALGSIRVPAHFCGLFGLKPTERRVSLFGHYCFGDIPGRPRAWRAICSVGPIARSIEDLELALGVIAGPDGRDTDVPPVPLAVAPAPPVRDLRIAWTAALPGVPVAREVSAAVERLAARLEAEGARVEQAVAQIDYGEMLQQLWPLLNLVGTSSDASAAESAPGRLFALTSALDYRDGLIRAWDAFAQRYDAFLCPPAPTVALPHAGPRDPFDVDGASVPWQAAAHATAPFNMTGQPALVVPFERTARGLPVGVQLVGRRWQDERLLAVGRTIAELVGPAPRPPGF